MRILSGIQPSGELHIGNYFGAMRQHVALQERGEGIYFIADYHSMTSVRDAALRRELVRDLALDYLACGLDPERSILYRQSDLPEVCELAWLLTTVTPMGLLERSHELIMATVGNESNFMAIESIVRLITLYDGLGTPEKAAAIQALSPLVELRGGFLYRDRARALLVKLTGKNP